MKPIFKEPLVHFLVLGALLFGAHAWLDRGGQGDAKARQVHLGAGEVAWLQTTWTRQWQREPTHEELRGLVMDFLKEELLAREAREMRLDENDTVVRRRLGQKLEFLLQDTLRLVEPTEDDLRRYHAMHAEQFRTDPRLSFAHVFYSRERRKDATGDAKAALAAWSGHETDVPASGDRLMLDSEHHDLDPQAVAALFGPGFAQAVFALRPDAWHGPIESGYGIHLVRVSELKPAQPRAFAEVRAQVLERWRDEREREHNAAYFAALLKKYDVVVDEAVRPLVALPEGGLTVARREDGAPK